MQVVVELRPHVGQMATALGVANVEHDQWMVFGKSDQVPNPVFLGYIGKREGAPFNGYTTYRDLPRSVKDDIVSQVAKLAGWMPHAFEPSTNPVPEAAFEPEADDDESEE